MIERYIHHGNARVSDGQHSVEHHQHTGDDTHMLIHTCHDKRTHTRDKQNELTRTHSPESGRLSNPSSLVAFSEAESLECSAGAKAKAQAALGHFI